MARRKLTSQQKKVISQFRGLGVLIFTGLLLLFGFIGLLIPLRPTVSEVENRTLTEFPAFDLSDFVSGTYFKNISTWYSDTFPLRDSMISANQKITALYGFKGDEQVVGTDIAADEIPDVASVLDTSALAETETTETAETADATQTTTGTQSQVGNGEATLPDSYKMEEEVQNQIQKRLYVKDGAAYTVYGFDQSAADIYIKALSNAATKLSGTANVYSILVPLNSGVMLDETTLNSLGGSDQQQTIDYYYNSYQGVTPIETIRILREHNNEYLYFRTDHHWTALGAYYAYTNFCEAKGWTPNQLSSFETMEFSPFLGTYYTKLEKPAEMAANPDSVTAYIPHGTNSMTYTDKNNETHEWNVIRDVSARSEGSGYATFIAGDNPMAVIENPNVTDGSSCLVLKESYGNCFVPFLVDHYSKIYIVDFRYATVNVADYVLQNNINDLIVINNIGIINSESVATTIQGLL